MIAPKILLQERYFKEQINLLGKESDEVCPAPIEDKECLEESKISWESKDTLWEIDWLVLKHEFSTMAAPWRQMQTGDFLKSFLVAFFHLLSSNWDLITDAQLTYSYINGNRYK